MSGTRPTWDARIAALEGALRALDVETADIREELRMNIQDPNPDVDLALVTAQDLAAAFLPHPHDGVTASVTRLQRALEELWTTIQPANPSDRTFRDRVLSGAVGRLQGAINATARAAAAAFPDGPPVPERRRTVTSAADRRQVQAFLGTLDEFQALVDAVARERDTAPSFVQQGDLVTFYVRGMTLEINTARLHLRVNKTLLDLGALVSGIEAIRDVTDRFSGNVQAWASRVTRNLVTGSTDLKNALPILANGINALGGMIDTPVNPASAAVPLGDGIKALGGMIDTPPPGPDPDWADDSGQDQFGHWASFTVTPADGGPAVTQRLRWIPPGTFRPGSPPDEEGRRDNENQGPEVTFAQGFWLFDTPCTQALWMAVMGRNNNPSHFKQNPAQPVEVVSFQDAQAFIRALNDLKPGLDLALPSETAWEYACRAGTDQATYAGPAMIDGKANAPVLDRIAWWSGNSERRTHPVGQKEPNGWGLYDMLGNVWEWCADAWHGSHDGADPAGAARPGSTAGRVIRGGSWNAVARRARAGYRDGGGPEDRGIDLGFRCVRGRFGLPVRSETRPAGTVQRQRRDGASRRSPPGAASSSP